MLQPLTFSHENQKNKKYLQKSNMPAVEQDEHKKVTYKYIRRSFQMYWIGGPLFSH